jgi:AmmeMemoRadiSam system protein B/AmmeMemoRadiSam system protein A
MRPTFAVKLFYISVVFMQILQSQVRESAVAGSFYSNDKSVLQKDLHSYFNDAKTFPKENIQALIVPHAGYVYSAQTAATAYKTLNKKYKNIFLIGSSHHVSINKASIYALGDYKTPLGEVKVNKEIVDELLKNHSLFTYFKDAHTKEHTLEVQLPFLQLLYGNEMQIVPIVLSISSWEQIETIAHTLSPYFNEENLFIISTDLSHYPSYEDAKKVDANTIEGILSGNTQTFISSINKNESLNTPELYTSACGWSSILVLQSLTQKKNYTYELLDYTNSGEKHTKNKERVVGYAAFRIITKEQNSYFTNEEKEQMLFIAKKAIHEATLHENKIAIDENRVLPKLKEKLGAFVTLYKNGELRGCIGRFEPNQPLYNVIVDMAIAAAQHDTRFLKVSPLELENIRIEISVLTPRKKINSISEIEIGKHGVYVQYGKKHGTYLPHVATQMGWSAEEFVKSCAIEKAQITPTELPKAELFTYEAIVFGE